jgi:hypothetical protein
MKKLKLYRLKKGETHSVFYIQKHENFLKCFQKFLFALGFEGWIVNKELLRLLGDVDNNYGLRKYSDKLYQDEYFYFESKQYKIDVFFGKKKIIVSIFTLCDKQKEISDLIFKFCDF